MKPQRATTPPVPGYPDAAEFSRHHQLALGAVIGAGLALAGCVTDPPPLGGVPAPPKSAVKPPQRTGGTPPVVRPAASHRVKPRSQPGDEGRTMGKMRVEPRPEPEPRLPGDVMTVPRD